MIRIGYVNGRIMKCAPGSWRELPAQGVDWVEVDHVQFGGKSIYWLYREGQTWVAGCASFYEDIKNPELVIGSDGKQTERQIDWVPDLRLGHIKLGWWKGKPSG